MLNVISKKHKDRDRATVNNIKLFRPKEKVSREFNIAVFDRHEPLGSLTQRMEAAS